MYQRFGNLYRRWLIPPVLNKCSRLITVSKFEKERIRNFFDWPDDGHLVTVYNGVNDYFKPIANDMVLSDIKKKYRLPDKFFFFPGNTDPKKNTKNVLRAYAGYIRKNGPTHKLVMMDYKQEDLIGLLNEIDAIELLHLIHLTGYVVNADLPAIYNQCDLFLYPSLRESFGLPILEAMACGTPVITSNTSSMPEISGGASLLTNPYDPNELISAIERLLSDQNLRAELRNAGISQAAKFSWEKMAVKVLDIYKDVLNHPLNSPSI
ncbi:MAG: glycosyltransferase family 1 protein, partial [Bacteroidota bacterium]|nr:glycosyltransferase family 1 protein [Bacteroidota bacterium]